MAALLSYVAESGLSQKAGIRIFIHLFDKGFQLVNFGPRLVAMPLLVTLLPVYFPYLLASYPGCFCYIVLHFLFRMLPMSTDFEYNDALIVNSIGQVNLRSEMFRRTRTLNKRPDDRFPLIK